MDFVVKVGARFYSLIALFLPIAKLCFLSLHFGANFSLL